MKSRKQDPKPEKIDFRSLIAIAAKGPANPNPKFKNEDELWEKDPDRS